MNLLGRRHTLLKAIRSFLDDLGYVEVETPCLVPATVPETHIDLFEVKDGLLLAASPEPHMKRLLAGGCERIYQITRAFRAGERGRWHNPEFTILEWYRAGAGHLDLMEETEALLTVLCAAAQREAPPIVRMTVDDAFERWAGWKPSRAWDEERFMRDMVERVEPRLAGLGSVFLHDYPAAAASLARLSPANPEVCERFELYVDGIEIANAFSELTDPAEQRRRLDEANEKREAQGRPAYPVDKPFIEALEDGLPPCAGIAIGVDRLVAVLLDLDGIDEAMAFPWPGR
ncbi:MAG: EF-P lysine aminoacylase GenX [Deltaproteobacteria bacterium]|nr:EF-P lysine aminoacylase GenX [Deltaproteobacteria bacterium]